MRAPSARSTPPLKGWALGFYHEDRNGHQIVGHGGDMDAFHSDLHILPDDGVGLFVSMNSSGARGAASRLRMALLRGFMDRYFPVTRRVLPTQAMAAEHGRMMAGMYQSSRRSESCFMTAMNLFGQVKVTADAEGVLEVSRFHDLTGAVQHWREVAPFVWQETAGETRLAAVVSDGRITGFATDEHAPESILQPVAGWFSAAWNLPLLYGMAGVLLFAMLSWPAAAVIRRHYGRPFPLVGLESRLHLLTRVAALADLIALCAFALIGKMMLDRSLGTGAPVDAYTRIAQGFCLLGAIGVGFPLWNAFLVWKSRGRGPWLWGPTAVSLLRDGST